MPVTSRPKLILRFERIQEWLSVWVETTRTEMPNKRSSRRLKFQLQVTGPITRDYLCKLGSPVTQMPDLSQSARKMKNGRKKTAAPQRINQELPAREGGVRAVGAD